MVRTRAADGTASGSRAGFSEAGTSSRAARPQRSSASAGARMYISDASSDASDSEIESDPPQSAGSDTGHSESDETSLELKQRPRRAPKGRTRRNPARRSNSTLKNREIRTQPERRRTPSVQRARPSAAAKRKRAGGTRQPSTPKKRQKPLEEQKETLWTQSVIPDWADPRITFEAWSDIFLYAAAQETIDCLDTNWLIRTATVCRAFEEPAINALYRNPDLTKKRAARRLATLLWRPPPELRFNYRAKIEALHIEAADHAFIYRLVHPLTRLKELFIYSTLDQPPYRQLLKGRQSWIYSAAFFAALGPGSGTGSSDIISPEDKPLPAQLSSWEWSGRFMSNDSRHEVANMSLVHQSTPFRHLTKLRFTNLQIPTLEMPEQAALDHEADDCAFIEGIGESLSHLQSLKELVFESSTVMDQRLLPLLPRGLQSLALINCWEVRSEDFLPFLETHGGALRTLILAHNQSLDLSFLTALGTCCPHLEELNINLSYYKLHDSVNDSDPMYDHALLPDQRPSWPASLRILNIEHIRDWSVEAAEMFFQSLVDDATKLPNLRYLAIKTMLNIPWQVRATMRNEWKRKLERVFLRPWNQPNPIRSIRQVESAEPSTPPRKKRRGQATPPSRRSGRIAAATDSDSRDKRFRQKGKSLSYRDPDTDEDDIDSSGSEGSEGSDGGNHEVNRDDDEERQPAIQGLCRVVSILFDNQKPRELQYGMEDFRDDDGDDSDEEWDGDEEEDETVFVWR